MPSAYSEDLRNRVIQAYQAEEGSQAKVAARFKISLSTFERYWRCFKKTGHVKPTPPSGGRPCLIHEQGMERLRKIVLEKPDRTLKEIAAIYNRNRKKQVSPFVIHYALKKLDSRRKKKSFYSAQQDEEALKK
jgi:transposase